MLCTYNLVARDGAPINIFDFVRRVQDHSFDPFVEELVERHSVILVFF